ETAGAKVGTRCSDQVGVACDLHRLETHASRRIDQISNAPGFGATDNYDMLCASPVVIPHGESASTRRQVPGGLPQSPGRGAPLQAHRSFPWICSDAKSSGFSGAAATQGP